SLMAEAQPSNNQLFHLVLEDEFFSAGKLWTDKLQDLVLHPTWSIYEIADWARVWVDSLKGHFQESKQEDIDHLTTLPGLYFDAIPRNLIIAEDGTARFIDLEWNFKEPIEVDFLFVRGMRDALFSLDVVVRDKQPYEFGELIRLVGAELGISLTSSKFEHYVQRELQFQETVTRFPISKDSEVHFLPIKPTEEAQERFVLLQREETKEKKRSKAARTLSKLIGRP
ncbi:MAG: hypothetical protein QNI90_13020, partial [Dinoroseobacter sp.]|nr:hypothetical protein [Dinoroseobacter sp.]